MTFLASTSGVRGTVGGGLQEGLNPVNVANYAAAYAQWVLEAASKRTHVLVGRDARPSGGLLAHVVGAALQGMGIEVWHVGLTTTPTLEMEVVRTGAMGGLMVTGSHNPQGWNALKFLNEGGIFLSQSEIDALFRHAAAQAFVFSREEGLGQSLSKGNGIEEHIRAITRLGLVDRKAIASRRFRIGVDAVCSTGGLAVPRLLHALGVEEVVPYFCEPMGIFPHDPEPLPEHIHFLAAEVRKKKLDLGLVVDPDVDRLAIICETGEPFGEEYTLVAAADYVLQHEPGATVSNLSSSGALQSLTESYGNEHYFSSVGEAHVVEKMKACGAVIGGEGNGGVIYPSLHYGRDALAGIALFLSHLALARCSTSVLRARYPFHAMKKKKIPAARLPKDVVGLLESAYASLSPPAVLRNEDGLRVNFAKDRWIHVRHSNTEPVLRIHAEAPTAGGCEAMMAEALGRMEAFL